MGRGLRLSRQVGCRNGPSRTPSLQSLGTWGGGAGGKMKKCLVSPREQAGSAFIYCAVGNY